MPPNYAISGYASEGVLFGFRAVSTDAAGALRKVRESMPAWALPCLDLFNYLRQINNEAKTTKRKQTKKQLSKNKNKTISNIKQTEKNNSPFHFF